MEVINDQKKQENRLGWVRYTDALSFYPDEGVHRSLSTSHDDSGVM
jgi:hypothetical protein